ncbi:MAG: peptidase S1 [Betaproteobacteria bacterium RIFCSPLOWO2_12_FULL_62_13]|nr:MAG: peptidase S1 [Betaproteobacteria bacterium RIFCSPLOWO2_12_FULL_62_13]
MKRPALYSRSVRSRMADRQEAPEPVRADASGYLREVVEMPTAGAPLRSRFQTFLRHRDRVLWIVVGTSIALLVVFGQQAMSPPAGRITQADIDAAVLRALETKLLPSLAAKAYEIVRPSVVGVYGFRPEQKPKKLPEQSVGTGVVIVDKGLILTNLHVVNEAERVNVIFADGHESEATLVGLRPEHDLAVLQANSIPKGLTAATIRSTTDLALGQEVIAVGFPFGIGPSVSAGVVSGLEREYLSPEGQRIFTNLIQFDAAVNPGSSGGPLVTTDGHVVGIVTAILNPTNQGVFIGIGFAVPIENAAAAVGIPPF